MRLIQQTPDTSDFDVIFGGQETPAFRILLPEALVVDGKAIANGCHTVTGDWQFERDAAEGSFSPSAGLLVRVRIQCRDSDMLVGMSVTNTSPRPFANVTANVCASVNHLPGDPGWCNRDFIPGVPLDRDLQGRHWYSNVTPPGLQALTGDGWVAMHPRPGDPNPDAVPKYSWVPSARDDIRACAVKSHDGSLLFFQWWDAQCRYVEPFPGNACMHLMPVIAAKLAPGETATVRGMAGVLVGDWAGLAAEVNSWLRQP